MSITRLRRTAALMVAGTLAVGAIAVGAQASSSVDEAVSLRRDLRQQIEQIHERRREARVAIHQRMKFTKARLHNAPRASGVGSEARYRDFRQRQLALLKVLTAQDRDLTRQIRARVSALRARREGLAQWLDTYGIFEACPVSGPVSIADNFGIIREMPGTPRHVHMGVDISAPTGAAIVAPFDGTAVASNNELGGASVSVYGPLGHVYNAHLSAYGQLGSVTAGTVVGYIGSTGNATAPHDHFEWHPGDGVAVDPYVYLTAACG